MLPILLLALQQGGPCPGSGFGPGAECRILMVAENPEHPAGRKIPIRYVVLRATGEKEPEALFLFSGGPGAASTDMVSLANGPLQAVRQRRDIVLVDQRGTGGSHVLMCDLEVRNYPARAFGHVFDPEFLTTCRKNLEKDTDLTRYTTEHAISDIDLVRRTEGYEKVILWGGSFGTRIAQSYARRYPDRVMAMVLDGVVPYDFKLPLSYAATLQESVNRTLQSCRSRAGCRDSFPDLEKQWQSLVERFRKGPVEVTVSPRNGEPARVRMHLGDFGYAVRGILYRVDQSRQLPAMIANAATSGDLNLFAQRYYSRAADFEADFADGLHLASLCSEETWQIRDGDVAGATAGSFIGRYLIDEYRNACVGWPRARLPDAVRQPLTAPVPVLLVSGYFDPVTPPEMADRVARHLPVHRHIVDSAGHHGTSFGCARPAVMHVLMQGTLEGLPEVCKGLGT